MKKAILLLLSFLLFLGLYSSLSSIVYGTSLSGNPTVAKGKILSLAHLNSRFFATTTVRIPATATPGTGLCSFDGTIRVTNSNVSVINISNTAGKGVTWKVEVTQPGTYQLQWSYAGGGSSAAEVARLVVNQTTVSEEIGFPKPKDSQTFNSTALVATYLEKGVNEIRVEALTSTALGDIAWLEVTGENPMAADCSLSIGEGGDDDPNATFALTATANPAAGGSIVLSPAVGPYARNTEVTVTAVPAAGYEFAGWSGNATGTNASLKIVMNSEKSVIGNFAPDSRPDAYLLTTAVRGQGSVTPASGMVNRGATVSLSATPASGWQFIGWTSDTTGTSNPLSLTMNSAKRITAVFLEGNAPAIDFTMKGFAATSGEGINTTTGGAGGQVIVISTFAQLEAWAASRERNVTPEIVHISGKISSPASTLVTIKNGANISILGLGTTAELQNVGLNIREYNNVIVRNLKMHEVLYPNDALTIDECRHVWIDHNEFHSKIGPGIGVDTYDGLLDIKKGSRFVTVSWNYFHDHMKNVLIGHTDNTGSAAQDSQIRVTFHHNYFSNTDGRNPSLRWGAAHLFNNYFKNIFDYGIALRQGAHGLIENNVYENVKLPISTNKFTGEGFACQTGNLFIGTSGANSITQTGCDWWTPTTLPYSYTLDPVESVFAIVPANVGVGIVNVTGSVTGLGKAKDAVNQKVQVYPNPSEGKVTFEVTLARRSDVTLSLYNLNGVKEAEVVEKNLSAGTHTLEYKKALKSGVYLYQVSTAEGTARGKLLIK